MQIIANYNQNTTDKNLQIIEASVQHSDNPYNINLRITKFYIVHFLLEGKGEYNGEKIQAGEGFLICPGKSHKFSYNPGWKHCWVSFSGQLAEHYINEAGLDNNNQTFSFSDHSEILEFVQKILAAKNLNSSLDYLSAFMFLLSKVKNPLPLTRVSITEKIKHYIDTVCTRQLTINEIAHNFHMSPKHLYKLFRQKYGVSIKTYLIDQRMNTAKDFLTSSDLKIYEIAQSVGYANEYNFCNIFKKHCGMTPTQYRKMHLKQ